MLSGEKVELNDGSSQGEKQRNRETEKIMANDAVNKVDNFASGLNAGNGSNAANAQDAANNPVVAEEKVDENLDMLLSDIGEILEEDAAAFVQGFVQKGGE